MSIRVEWIILTTADRGRRRVTVLALGTFAVGTDAFVVAGVLPDVASSLHVTISDAGQLVTVFSVAYALLCPLLATLTGRWPRRRVLLVALAVFVLGNAATALAPTFELVLTARVVAAAGATLFTPIAGAAAASLAPSERRARAIAIVTAGLTTSTALGAPLGTVIGNAMGWRNAMWFVAALGVLAAVGITAVLPDVPGSAAVGLRQRLAPLVDRRVIVVLLATVLLFTGVYVVYTYISVVFARATGTSGNTLAMLLFAWGVAGTAGNFLAGHFADRIGSRAVVGIVSVVLIVVFGLLPVGAGLLPSAFVLVVIYGMSAWSITTPQQHRLISLAPDSAPLVVSLNASFLYLAVALSGIVGAVGIQTLGGGRLGLIAAGFVMAGGLTSELAHRSAHNARSRPKRPAPPNTGARQNASLEGR